MTDTQTTPAEQQGGEQQQDQTQTFSQADVDKIVKERVARERAKYADYDDLKAKAGQATSLEDRVAEIERTAKAAEQRALRAEIANAHGISAEDRDLFLTGTDEETLTAQAKRLADRESERKKQGNHVPNEGKNPKPVEDEKRAFARKLFASGE